MLELNSVPIQSRWCTVRHLDDGYVVYNSRTDELHVLPPAAHYTYELCDGERTVEAVADLLAGNGGDVVLQDRVLRFLRVLEERGVVMAADG